MLTKIEVGREYVLRDGRIGKVYKTEPTRHWSDLGATRLAYLVIHPTSPPVEHCVWADGTRAGRSEVKVDRDTDLIRLYNPVFEPEQLPLFEL